MRRFACGWVDVGLWGDVALLADRYWSAPADGKVAAWHHLVLAVGNFKRDAGRRLRPAALPGSFAVDAVTRPGDFVVPGPDPAVTVRVASSAERPPSTPPVGSPRVGRRGDPSGGR